MISVVMIRKTYGFIIETRKLGMAKSAEETEELFHTVQFLPENST